MSCLCCQGYGPTRDEDVCCGGPEDGHDHGHDHGHGGSGTLAALWREGTLREAVVYAAALQAAAVAGRLWPAAGGWPFVAAMAVGLYPVLRRVLAELRRGNPFSIEMLMTISAVGAVAIGAVGEAATVVLLFLVGEILESLAAGRAQAGIERLVALVPQTALLEEEGGTRSVAAASLTPGQVIVAGAGERIAADGEVIDGMSGVDESPLTGESRPKPKGPGDAVYAGTVNGEGVLRLRVTADASDNAIARVVRLVREAQARKAPVQRIVERFARVYTPCVVAAGAAVAVLPPLLAGADWTTWIYRGLAVLLIGCPCALVISTPAALAAALASGAGRGLLIKGGAVLESLARADAVAFDKTGTLTRGRPAVAEVAALAGSRAEVLALAAGLSLGSTHPMARAVLAAAAAEGVAPAAVADLAALPGRGVSGRVDGVEAFFGAPGADAPAAAQTLAEGGRTVSLVRKGGDILGLIAAADEAREDAAAGVAALKAIGARVVMLTGDVPAAAAALADSLGIEARAGLLPEDKLAAVREMQAQGAHVVKVGDGINDAPALAAADVGIAFGGGTDVALETADAASLHGHVGDVAAMILLARRAMATIRQNVALAIGLKLAFLVTTVLGITGLWPAVLADTGATVLVTANALRLLRR
ncbi:heavy metal translocating P-type ATPase [Oleispirillum naphthae]|uniref:heavy metal translocating P-type ATPase n=1 Tax=Oleispirillum naphthae TaxID=2838853 RepID=UPI0030824FA4